MSKEKVDAIRALVIFVGIEIGLILIGSAFGLMIFSLGYLYIIPFTIVFGLFIAFNIYIFGGEEDETD